MTGRFVTIEGGEGTGKSTQADLLVAALARAGIAARRTREPGGSPGAEAIRRLLIEGEADRWDPLSETLLLLAARRDHVLRLIRPALDAGEWVVCDRFADSTTAYQGHGKAVPLDSLAALDRLTLGRLAPDLTVILDLPVETGLARAAARSAGDRFERLGRDFHDRVREGYRRIAAAEPERCVLVDARPDPPGVHRTICDAVARRLGVVFPPG